MKKKYLLSFFILFFYQNSYATIYIDGKIISGKLSGFSQIPQGGSFDSTSNQRPSFDELKLDYDTFYQIEGGVNYDPLEFYGKYSHIHMNASQTLRSNLMTRGKTISAGNVFNATFDYDWYTLGLAYTYPLSEILLFPSVDLNYITYDYTFSSTSSSSRTFSHVTPRVGLRICYPINPDLTLNLYGASSIPLIKNAFKISELNTSLHWLAIDDSFQIIPYIGVGFFKIDYKDGQIVPNHIQYTLSPNISIGVRMQY